MRKRRNLIWVMLYPGKGVKKDEQQAAIWMRKAAEQGLSAAQVQLGEIYYYGLGVERDYVQAGRGSIPHRPMI